MRLQKFNKNMNPCTATIYNLVERKESFSSFSSSCKATLELELSGHELS